MSLMPIAMRTQTVKLPLPIQEDGDEQQPLNLHPSHQQQQQQQQQALERPLGPVEASNSNYQRSHQHLAGVQEPYDDLLSGLGDSDWDHLPVFSTPPDFS
jgi:hypothetical protein